MPWYPVKWGLALGEQDVATKDQLRNKLAQKEEEIRRLQKAEERLMKDAKELEEQNEELDHAFEIQQEELELLRKRDKLTEELIEAVRSCWVENCLPRRVYDLITDWEQAGMSLSR